MDHQHAGFAHSSSCLDQSQRSTAHEQERGQVLLVFSRKTENAPVQDPAPVLYTWGVSWLENTFNSQNSSPGVEFLLSRATISSYSHCGLTSTSWGKNFPPHPLAGQLQDTGTKACSSFTNSKIAFASGKSCTQSTRSGGKIPPRPNRMTGQEVH